MNEDSKPARRRWGYRIVGSVVDVKGKCGRGHKAGDQFEISVHDTAGLCGIFYHGVYPAINLLQFGGAQPWNPEDMAVVECPDRENAVRMELRRIRE